MFTEEQRAAFYNTIPPMMYHFPHMYFLQQRMLQQQERARQQQFYQQQMELERGAQGSSSEEGEKFSQFLIVWIDYLFCTIVGIISYVVVSLQPASSFLFLRILEWENIFILVACNYLDIFDILMYLIYLLKILYYLISFYTVCIYCAAGGRMDADSLKASGMLNLLMTQEGRVKLQGLAAKVCTYLLTILN